MSAAEAAMRAMVLEQPGGTLMARELPVPQPSAGQLLLRVHACGVCRTDLHILDGELVSAALRCGAIRGAAVLGMGHGRAEA